MQKIDGKISTKEQLLVIPRYSGITKKFDYWGFSSLIFIIL